MNTSPRPNPARLRRTGLALVTLGVLLVGCGGDDPAQDAEDTAVGDAPTTDASDDSGSDDAGADDADGSADTEGADDADPTEGPSQGTSSSVARTSS